MKESKIMFFNPEIYPINLYISVTPEIGEIVDKFYVSDNNGNLHDFEHKPLYGEIATVIHCYKKKEKEYCVLCCIWNKKNLDVRTIAHEATHIASLIFEILGIELDGFYGSSNDPFAYLSGWAADCLYRVKISKNV